MSATTTKTMPDYPDLKQFTDEVLANTRDLLKNDSHWRGLAERCELELIRRKLPPINEVFPEGGYVEETNNGQVTFVPVTTTA